jgi:hypothetical protein
LLGHLPLTMPGGIDLYFEWPARDRRADSLESLKATRRAKLAAFGVPVLH